MFGAIKFEDFEGLTKLPQKAATAWAAVEGKIVGASFKPLLFIGTQVARGTNYWFIVEETTVTNPPTKHITTLAINEFNGLYSYVPGSIEIVFA